MHDLYTTQEKEAQFLNLCMDVISKTNPNLESLEKQDFFSSAEIEKLISDTIKKEKLFKMGKTMGRRESRVYTINGEDFFSKGKRRDSIVEGMMDYDRKCKQLASEIKKTIWEIHANADLEYINKDFQSIEIIYNPEFNRDWNLDSITNYSFILY